MAEPTPPSHSEAQHPGTERSASERRAAADRDADLPRPQVITQAGADAPLSADQVREALSRILGIVEQWDEPRVCNPIAQIARVALAASPKEPTPDLSDEAHPDDIEINEQAIDRLREREAEVSSLSAENEKLRTTLERIDNDVPSEEQWHRMGDSMWANIGRSAAKLARSALAPNTPEEES